MASRSVSRLHTVARRFMSSAPRAGREAYDAQQIEIQKHAAETAALWKKLSIFVAAPFIAVCFYQAVSSELEHMAHWERPEFIPYDHMYQRTKAFPWGDGNHGLFHGHNNPTPDGYDA